MKLGKGREGKRLTLDVREVPPEEVRQAKRVTDPVVKRFRESHHMMAKLAAMGLKTKEIAIAVGMNEARVGMFVNDPAFRELVASYRQIIDPAWAVQAMDWRATQERVARKSLRQIEDQIDEADHTGEQIPLRTLHSLTADLADRLGYAKQTVSINVDATFAARLDRAIERSGLKQIDGTVSRAPPEVEGVVEGKVPALPSTTNTVANASARTINTVANTVTKTVADDSAGGRAVATSIERRRA